jgi:hypothetical protein
MQDRSVCEDISTAPFDRDLELAVIEADSVHALVFACRRALDGWIMAQKLARVIVHRTQWSLWAAND